MRSAEVVGQGGSHPLEPDMIETGTTGTTGTTGATSTTAAGPQAAGSTSFDRLVASYQSALLAHCYRMSGSQQDAEDALQEALLRAWRNLGTFEGRSSMRTWLFTIATNSCRRLIEQRARRVLPMDLDPPSDPRGAAGPPLEESTWVTPFPGAAIEASPPARYEDKETVELAFGNPPAPRCPRVLRRRDRGRPRLFHRLRQQLPATRSAGAGQEAAATQPAADPARAR